MKLQRQEQADFSLNVEEILAGLDNVKKQGNGWTARCPSHDDHRNSLSVGKGNDDKGLLHCHAGCDYITIITDLGLYKEPKKPSKKEIKQTYDYVDEYGELKYQVVRFEPKSFAQRQPSKDGGWVWNLKGVHRILYRLPELVRSDKNYVFVVEGERDADNLTNLGFVATTNSGGAGKWIKDYNKYFKSKDVIIIPDNDEPGKAHAQEVAKNVYNVAASVRIINLEGLEDKEDLSDWIEKDKETSVDTLNTLVSMTEPLQFTEEELNFDDTKPSYLEGEKAIIGAIFKDNKLIAKVIDADVAKAFFFPETKTIIETILECFENKKGLDILSVSEELRLKRKLDAVGGVKYLKELETETPDTLNIDSWIEIVRQKAQFRHYIKVAEKLGRGSYGEFDNPDKIGEEAVKNLFNIRSSQKKDSFTHLTSDIYSIIDTVKNLDGRAVTGLSTGFIALDEITAGLQKTDFIVLAGRPSMGKCLSNDYKVLTPEGWTTMGQLKVGDKVIGSSGKPITVTGVYPQGFKPMYSIRFSDGVTSESCDEHLWFVQSRQDRKKKLKGQVLSLKEIAKNLKTSDGRNNFCIPYVKPVAFNTTEITLHPYLLGALLGDGSLSGNSVKFTNKDSDVVQKIISVLPYEDILKKCSDIEYIITRKSRDNSPSETRKEVLNLGINVTSSFKFIPKPYLYGDLRSRINLLRGLLDTDGYVDKVGWIEYSTTSKQLAIDVRELVLSLGGRSTVQNRITSYTYKGEKKEGKMSYRVRITFPHRHFNPFICKRKEERFDNSKSSRKNGRYIVSVDYVCDKDSTCIKVDSEDQLFVIKDYVLTHNTALALSIGYNASKIAKVAFFSLEMSKEQLVRRILCSEARVDSSRFKTGNLTKEEWARIASVIPEMESCNLYVCDTPALSATELRSKAHQAREELDGLDLIVVDYLQLMTQQGRENRQQEVSQISREMKALAKELGIPIVALSQLSRAPEARNPPKPLMSDLRESGSLEQDADVVGFVYREDYYDKLNEDCKGITDIIIAKQRNGPTGTIQLAWLEKLTRFENMFEFKGGIKL